LHSVDIIDEGVFKKLLKEVGNALYQADVNILLIKKLRETVREKVDLENAAPGVNRRKLIQETLISELRNLVDPGKKPWRPKRDKFNVIMFVGLQGAGKTTSCSKLAYHYKEKGFKVGLVCADTYRAGAYEQLRMNAAKTGVTFFGDTSSSDPAQIALEGMETFQSNGMNLVIVDTSGRHKQETALFEEMTAIHSAINPDETIFVMDSTIGQAAYDQAKAFHDAVEVGSVILTKLDGSAKGGGALSAVAATNSPITFIGVGEHMQDLDPFDPSKFINRILGKGNIGDLAKKIKEAEIDESNQEELMRKLQNGNLSLRDLKEQFQNVLKLGPMNSIIQMIPGFSNMDREQGESSQKRIQRFLIIMDSMNEKELDADIRTLLKHKGRQKRICQGSGLPPQVLNELWATFQPLEAAAKKLKNVKMNGSGMPTNPADMMKVLPPQVLEAIGGPAGLRKFMKDMEGKDFDQESLMRLMGKGGSSTKAKGNRRRKR